MFALHVPRKHAHLAIAVQLEQHAALNNTLIAACERGDANAVEALLERGTVDVNYRAEGGRTALYVACSRGKLDVVHVLLQNSGTRSGVTCWWTTRCVICSIDRSVQRLVRICSGVGVVRVVFFIFMVDVRYQDDYSRFLQCLTYTRYW